MRQKLTISVLGKLSGISAIGMLFIIAAAAFALSQLWGAVQDYHVQEEQVIQELDAGLGLQAGLFNQIVSWKNYLLRSDSAADRSRYRSELESSMEAVRGHLARLDSLLTDAAARSHLAQVEQAHRVLSENMSEGQEAVASGRVSALDMDESMEGATAPVTEALDALIHAVEERAAERAAAIESSALGNLYTALASMGTVLLLAGLGVFWLVRRSVVVPLQDIDTDLKRMADGDFSKAVTARSGDEIGRLAVSAERLRRDIGGILAELRDSSAQVAAAAEELSTVGDQTTEGVDRQRADTDDVAAAMNEMSTTVQEVARNASQTSDTARGLRESTDTGRQTVRSNREAVDAVNDAIEEVSRVVEGLNAQAEDIGEVIEVITDVAGQTNLLALNAAIEAARAGDAGRGFAVVAEEVRGLAQKTQASTGRIESIVENLRAGATDAMNGMNAGQDRAKTAIERAREASEAFESIEAGANQIVDYTDQIATATEEQSSVSDEINRNISNISSIARDSAASVTQLATAGRELTQLAGELQRMSQRFVTT